MKTLNISRVGFVSTLFVILLSLPLHASENTKRCGFGWREVRDDIAVDNLRFGGYLRFLKPLNFVDFEKG